MKKLSALIAMFLCVTIGGVYATWSYAGTDDIADKYVEAKVTIADISLTGANGVYTIESNLVLSVDQANDDHLAELVFSSNNSEAVYLKITFTPATNATPDIKKGAVPSELYFGTTTPMQYRMNLTTGRFDEDATPIDIFKFSNVSNGSLNANITWTKYSMNGTETLDDDSVIADENAYGDYFVCVYDKSALEGMIMLNDTVEVGGSPQAIKFVLGTKEEHDIFGGQKEVKGKKEGLVGNIVARVTDGTVN